LLVLHCLCDAIDFQLFGTRHEPPSAAGSLRRRRAALAGCVPVMLGAGGAAAYSSLEDRRSTGTQIDDESIEVRAGNPRQRPLRWPVHVNVTSYNRIALLTGEVPDDAARAEVEKIVRACPRCAM